MITSNRFKVTCRASSEAVRRFFACVKVGDQVFVIGGGDTINVAWSTVYSYDLKADIWASNLN